MLHQLVSHCDPKNVIRLGHRGPFPRNFKRDIENKKETPKSGVNRRYRWKNSNGTFILPFLEKMNYFQFGYFSNKLMFYPKLFDIAYDFSRCLSIEIETNNPLSTKNVSTEIGPDAINMF